MGWSPALDEVSENMNIEEKRYIIQYSLEDVIDVLQGAPIQRDMVAQITVVQVMNRIPVAHLSIERAMKFLITEAGGQFDQEHGLEGRLKELNEHDKEAADFLDTAFREAVEHYRYNPKAHYMGHLESLQKYMHETGSNAAFQSMRYWELDQSLGDDLIRRIYPSLHLEILHALREILLNPDRPKDTVKARVERAAEVALINNARGTSVEDSLDRYLEWLQRHGSFREAMASAVKETFNIGDDYAQETTRRAYKELMESKDPAVRYFTATLDVLPKQPRDAIPEVDWVGPEKERVGKVSTPGGKVLGFIERGNDGLWYITPSRNGLVRVSAKAQTQTDARCYLAELLTRTARVIADDEVRQVRLAGEEYDLFKGDYGRVVNSWEDTVNREAPVFEVTFWDAEHALTSGTSLRLEVPRGNPARILHVLEGTVTEVKDHRVFVRGRNYFDVAR